MEAVGASRGEVFFESLEAEEKASKIRLRLRLRIVFDNFFFNLKSIRIIPILNFSKFLLLLLSTYMLQNEIPFKSVYFQVKNYFLVVKHYISCIF